MSDAVGERIGVLCVGEVDADSAAGIERENDRFGVTVATGVEEGRPRLDGTTDCVVAGDDLSTLVHEGERVSEAETTDLASVVADCWRNVATTERAPAVDAHGWSVALTERGAGGNPIRHHGRRTRVAGIRAELIGARSPRVSAVGVRTPRRRCRRERTRAGVRPSPRRSPCPTPSGHDRRDSPRL